MLSLPTINITGSNPQDPKQNRSAAFDVHEKSQVEAAKRSAQVDAAFDQREAQVRGQMEAMWKQEAALKKSQMAAEKQQFQQELSARSAALAGEKARESERQKQHVILMRADKDRLRKEQTQQNTEARKEASVQRQADAGWERLRKQRERQAQIEARAMDPNTYRLQNISRLGMRGMRAADTGSWIELHRSERELNRIEKNHGSHPAIATALKQARMRVAVGKESQSPGRLAVGQGAGLLGDFLSSPEVGLVIAAAMGAATAPLLLGGAMSKGLSYTRPFQDPRAAFLSLGRSGGFSGQGLMDQFYKKGMKTPQWMLDAGVTPEGAAGVLGKYGIATSGPEAGKDLVRTIAKAQYAPSLGGLGFERYASMANFGRNIGLTDEPGMQDYFRKYAQVTAIANAQGLDKSKAISNIEGLLKQATSAGGGGLGGGEGIFQLYKTLMASGNPSMRSGEGISRVLGGFQAAAGQIGFGGGTSQNLAVSNFIAKSGGASAFGKGGKGWATLFGSQSAADAFAASNPDFMNKVYSAAGQGPGMLTQAIGDVITQKPELMDTIGRYAPAAALGGYAGALGEATTRGGSVFDLTTQRGAEAVNSPKARQIYDMLLKKGYPPAAASGILANIMREDPNLDPRTRNAQGMTGLLQWNQERRGNFFKKYGFGIGQANTQQQIDFLADEMGPNGPYSGVGQQLRSGNLSAGQSAYLMSTKNVVPSLNPRTLVSESNTRSRGAEQIQRAMSAAKNPLGKPGSEDMDFGIDVGNMPLDYNAAQVNTTIQQIAAAQGASKLVVPGINSGADMFKNFSDGVTSFNGSVTTFASAVDKFAATAGQAKVEHQRATGYIPTPNRANSEDPVGYSWLPSWLQPQWHQSAPRKN